MYLCRSLGHLASVWNILGTKLSVLGLFFSTFQKLKAIDSISGAGDGNRTNANGQNKGVTTRFVVQLESNWSQV
jgi:hypothetical protein